MAKSQAAEMVPESLWSGGVSPFGVSWQKLMMWIFIITDGLLFAGLLAGYGFLRLASPQWPDQTQVFYMPFIAFMTFVLITSSATMGTAVGAARQRDRRWMVRGLVLTILGGLIFLGCQAYEWTHLIHQGARLYTNPWGVPHFTACFFVLTGFHGSHVLSGVIILTITLIRTLLGKTTPEGVEIAGLYWHFVDLVWVFIFTLFYLL
ncbi:MAG: cytochrome c oxidase subunit 3 [Acidobacteria bacterium]|nr:cytochrome c oxidase subunit 3 [Acidobacteriota bacterium]MDW7983858.1 cytochrome c oxidase subunit 3 [Acidobacteriota bacterium]